MNEKGNLNDNLIQKSEEKNKSFPVSRQFFFEDYSNTESIKNSIALSEYDEEIISDKEVNSYLPKKEKKNNFFLNVNANKSYSHKSVNSIIGFKFGKSKIFDEDERKSRESYSVTYHKVVNFSKRTHYILYMCNLLSFSINYEAIWRFPYYFIFAEGATFFIPFIIFYFLLGIPILTLESSLGQIFKSWSFGQFLVNKKKKYKYYFSINTIIILVLVISYIITLYFGSLVSQSIHYFLLAFSSQLPWEFQLDIDKLYNLDFYKNKFIIHDSTHQNFDIFKLGDINYHKLFSTFIFWFIFYLLLIFKMDITKHKFIYRFICFGPIIIIMLIFLACIHPRKGFIQGCIYFLIPKMERLLNYKPWLCGINQAVFLLMLGNGKNLIFSSSIKENDNVYARSTLTSLLVLFLGIFCTFFSCIYAGLISEELKLDSINDIPFNNSNLPFVTYLLALGMMKYNRFFSILFLLSLIVIGYQTLYLFVGYMSTFLQKTFNKYLNYYTAPLLLCSINFILCIPYTRFQGQFFLEWIDKYISFLPIIFVIFYEIIFINEKLGINLLLELIANKTGIVLPLYIFYFTKYITPFVLLIMMIFAFVYQQNNKQNSIITTLIEWIFLLSPFVVFLIFFIRDWNYDKKDILKKEEDNILKNNSYNILPKRENERKGKESIGNLYKKGRNASFSSKKRKEKYILKKGEDTLSDEVENSFKKRNDDLLNNMDYNSISISNNNTRKPTIEMEYINQKDKNQ